MGVTDRRSAFHTPMVATVSEDGSPALRTVVLRAADADKRTLRFHTDARSAKFGELWAAPRVALGFYDPVTKVQLRVDGTATLHTYDALGLDAWRGTRPMSRACYRILPAPGSKIGDPRRVEAVEGEGHSDAGADNFAAVLVAVDRLEWLYLAARGHRRARFTWDEESMEVVWLVP